jgi:hypothetical protein
VTAARSLAPEWDRLWGDYIQARRDQDEQRIRDLEARMHRWHVRNDMPVPEWLEGCERQVRHG